jgi:hypothetical protein
MLRRDSHRSVGRHETNDLPTYAIVIGKEAILSGGSSKIN